MPKVDRTGFLYSHEILFNKKIYLKDYCKCIIFNNNNIPENYILLANKLNIIIKKYSDMKNKSCYLYGLNNFIKLIEE